MNNLKPNMYIRTKEGKIDKVLEINTEDFDEPVVRLASYPLGMYQGNFEYEKASHNIIDIIEEGDYVNGYMVEKVVKVPSEEIDRVVKLATDNVFGWEYEAEELYKDEIKSIVTKEQFKSISYEVSK